MRTEQHRRDILGPDILGSPASTWTIMVQAKENWKHLKNLRGLRSSRHGSSSDSLSRFCLWFPPWCMKWTWHITAWKTRDRWPAGGRRVLSVLLNASTTLGALPEEHAVHFCLLRWLSSCSSRLLQVEFFGKQTLIQSFMCRVFIRECYWDQPTTAEGREGSRSGWRETLSSVEDTAPALANSLGVWSKHRPLELPHIPIIHWSGLS